MQHKANPTLIGLFVLVGVAIGIGALLLFAAPGSGGKPYEMVVYFEGDVNGLVVGSPVNLRGVQIGRVKSIQISFEQQGMHLQIPVIISIDQNRIGLQGESMEDTDADLVNRLISNGLRARLKLQSLLTGRLQVDLDFFPATKARLVGTNTEYLELPTIPSELDKLTKSLAQLPIEELAAKALNIMDGVERLVTAPELIQTVENLGKAGADAAMLIDDLRTNMAPLLQQWRIVGADADILIKNIDNQVQPLVNSTQDSLIAFQESIKQLNAVFAHTEQTLSTFEAAMNDRSPLYQELQSAIREIGSAARAFRVMAEYLETHPEALLQGKPHH